MQNFFNVCKSVHHHTIQINNQPDATIFQFIILTFIYSSTCFGRFPAHHQELNDCSGSLWFYLRIVGIVVLLFVVGPAGPTTNNNTLVIYLKCRILLIFLQNCISQPVTSKFELNKKKMTIQKFRIDFIQNCNARALLCLFFFCA